ncbi:protein spire homolog 1-like isoform X3 [Dysidea avara]|uniref:protein spire homolog 1-like isoform X3 n=1 Tax=Dysidea avara TaxID=196820 RepID=UPI00332DC758
MSTSTSGRSERSLSDLLNIFRAPLSEDQSWAVCYQCARKLQRLRNEYGVAAIPALSLASVFVTSMGEVDVRKAKRLRAASPAYHSIKEAISALGMLVYDVLDYGLSEDEERALPQTLEHLIDLMTTEECDTTSDIGSDCDSDSDQILGITRKSSREISLEEIIKVCKSRLQSSIDMATHYQLVCRSLYDEATELTSLSLETEEQDRADHRKKWVDVVKNIKFGKTLRKVSSTNSKSSDSLRLSAYDIVQLAVKSFSKENLKPVEVNSSSSSLSCDDPHTRLMKEIRTLKPNLKPVTDRAKGRSLARVLTPMETLMEEIKTPPTLRRVHTNHVTVSDTMTIMYRKKLVPSADLVADLSDESLPYYVSCPEVTSDVRYSSCQELRESVSVVRYKPRSRSSPSSPNPRHHLTHKHTDSPLCTAQSSSNTASMNTTKFRSISVSGLTSGLASVVDRLPRHSWHIDDDYTDPIEEVTSPDSGSVLSDDEYPSTTRELIHIRYILSTADLVNLQLYNIKMYKEIIRGKLCSACKSRRFSLMSRPHTCVVCQKMVCGKCVSKILLSPDDLPVDHPVKLLGRRNSSDVCTPCRDFITSAGGVKCHQVPSTQPSSFII